MKIDRSVILGSLVGGLILLICSIISWKTIYWEGIIVKNFKNEGEVERVMRRNAPESGVYVMPRVEDTEAMDESLPVIFTGINLEGKRPIAMVLISSYIMKVVLAFIGIWLLKHHNTKMPYGKKVGFFVLIGCVIAIASKVSFMIKGYYSVDFALYSIFAVVAQWFFAGLAMAKMIKHR